MNNKRVRLLNGKNFKNKGPIAYWMSRDQRADDNWALLFAQELAIKYKQPLAVVFCLVDDFLGATFRQYSFMLDGLQQIANELNKKNMPFYLLLGQPEKQIPKFVRQHKIENLVTDFDPLKIKRNWKKIVAAKINIPFYEVDAHNIVPCWLASPKQEFGAYTIRPKIHKLLPEFSDDFPKLKKHPFKWAPKVLEINWAKITQKLHINRSVDKVDWLQPGPRAAKKILKNFIENKLRYYEQRRNDPNQDGQSNLSPYLHFGQLSAQRIAFEVQKTKASLKTKNAFLEELIVRRELSDNFCLYNQNYDNTKSFAEWDKLTLKEHKKDKRPYHYSTEEFEHARTHDELWNAAQLEMVTRGKMHGYMRMYWAKKILEWSKSPEEAMQTAIYLNDKYELDGRDPNGYAGIAWSIGGIHDRPWPQRPIFGKIRYMSYAGCKSKFNIEQYISAYIRPNHS
jgi:deoxyribodipyrimidine photo-lyase